jgi:type II secretory pathway pseudopilin PulG
MYRNPMEGEGLSFGQQPDKEAKRRQQADYARALQQQVQEQQHQNSRKIHPSNNANNNITNYPPEDNKGLGLQIGQRSDVDAKKAKQEQYAAELREQMAGKQSNNMQNNVNNVENDNIYGRANVQNNHR